MAAMTTMPALSAGPGVTADRSQPSETHDSAVSSAAVASPVSEPFAVHATASSAPASGAASSGRAPWAARPRASAASGGTGTQGQHGTPLATALDAAHAAVLTQ